ncbi:MAG: ribonuclease J [Candidatus Doudnabacteria bacterium]|nr:ribonuclease J [Candidatus Doudnabacteria bacterium]
METQNLKIIPLGGVEEIGINCTVYQYKNEIVVVDVGAGFPDANMYGVDLLIPNFDYLVRNQSMIKGILITHGHLDHIGALKYVLPRIGFPTVYGSKFTIEMIRADMEEAGLTDKVKLEYIDENTNLQLGSFNAEFFRVNHSIPQCLGIYLTTPASKIVHTGDFKFDNSPVNEPVADYAKIARIGEKGVDVLLSDSTNATKKGYPLSENDVARGLEMIIERAKGRVFVASFSGLVGRLYQIMQIAERMQKKVAIAGYSMQQTLRIAQEIGYIKPKQGLLIPIQSINRYHDDRLIILTTGAQGESNAALYRMALGEYKNVKIKQGDSVIISAGTIPGNNMAVQQLIEVISATGASVSQSEGVDFFTSGHGYQEDQKIMLNLTKPKYFMPVHGYQYFLREHGKTAVSVGVKAENIIIAKRGEIIEGSTAGGFTRGARIKSNPVLVSGTGVGDVGESVLQERQQLGNHGVIVIDINVNAEKKALMNEPFVVTRGFVYIPTSKDLLGEIRKLAENTLNKKLKETNEVAELRKELEDKIGYFVAKEIGRNPMILSVISFTNPQGSRPKQKQIDRPRKQLTGPDRPTGGNANGPDQAAIAAKWKIPTDSLDLLKKREI